MLETKGILRCACALCGEWNRKQEVYRSEKFE